MRLKKLLEDIEKVIVNSIPHEGMEIRWLSIKLFERDENVIES